ncbi:MAG: undecaprenyl-diphosphate phosphatase [Deltaproteobacteria bacterium]|jgi:undecaprenyl-diphosphatase|nr:undecaprenyl-diphosphate phosphatase [Deltaproteobacteria bacterium]
MTDLPAAAILGLLEGLTEFLPVSSTGHLILARSLLGLSGGVVDSFTVVIQSGAILAVLVLYRQRFRALLPFARRPPGSGRFSGFHGLLLLGLTSLPACLAGLAAHSVIKERLFNPAAVALALIAGALCMLFLEYRKREPRFLTPDEITPGLALGIGLCQCLALWPGFSRSAATIMGGMLLGVSRGAAAEYSFIAAVPVMFAATAFDLCVNLGSMGWEELPFFAVGLAAAFLSALAAIKGFLSVLGRIGLAPFAWYRLLLAPLTYWFFS